MKPTVTNVSGIELKPTVEQALNAYSKMITRLEPPLQLTADGLNCTFPDEQKDPLAYAETKKRVQLLHAVLGVSSESGEFSDALKKALFAGRPLDTVNIMEEFGDKLWYMQLGCNALGITLLDCIIANTEKLYKRHGEKFNLLQAGNYGARDLAAERQVLEAATSTLSKEEQDELAETQASPRNVPAYVPHIPE